MLVLTGEQGAAKSTTARLLKTLLDPAVAPLWGEPRGSRDLMIYNSHQHLLVFDNISRQSPWLSDRLCRLVTGSGFVTRGLYTDEEETIFDPMRPVLLNGIPNFVIRPDLLERSILLRLPPIPEEQLRDKESLHLQFKAARPRLLSAELDRLSGLLRERDHITLPDCHG